MRLGRMSVTGGLLVAGLGLEMLLIAIVDQGVQPVDRLDPDIDVTEEPLEIGGRG